MLSIVLTFQTLVGSLSVALGAFVGYWIGSGTTAGLIYFGITAGCELLRAGVVTFMIKSHKKENIALP